MPAPGHCPSVDREGEIYDPQVMLVVVDMKEEGVSLEYSPGLWTETPSRDTRQCCRELPSVEMCHRLSVA